VMILLMVIIVLLIIVTILLTKLISFKQLELNDASLYSNQGVSEILYVKDTVRLNNIDIMLYSTTYREGNSTKKPEEGKKLISFGMQVSNNSSKPVTILPEELIKLVDSGDKLQSMIYDERNIENQEIRLIKGELKGMVVTFEVDSSETYWELIFEHNEFGEAKYAIYAEDIEKGW